MRPTAKLRFVPDPVLVMDCYYISKVDEDVLAAISDAKRIMAENNGVGIAAPQIGIPLRFCIVKDITMINPEVISRGNTSSFNDESCLSIPNTSVLIERCDNLVIKYKTEDGKYKTTPFNGIDARIAQHELDHLNGILITDEENWKQTPTIKYPMLTVEQEKELQFWFDKI